MDILVFILAVTGFVAAHHYGYMKTGLAALRTAYRKCRNLLDRAELHFVTLAARRVVITLIASAVVQLTLLMGATALLPTSASTDWYGTFIAISAILIAAEVAYALYQRPGIPHVLRDVHGLEKSWPEFLENEQGEFVDEEGRVLQVDGNERIDARVPHPLAGLPQLDNEHYPNLLGRISAGWSMALVLFAFAMIGAGIMTVGVHGRSSLVFLLGAMCVYAMLMALQLVANILAWFVLKGTKLLEFIATIVTEQALVILPGIKWNNIETYLPSGVDILDEEHAAAVLRAFPLRLAMHITPFVAVVWMWTDPAVAKFVLALLVITSLTGWYLAKNGGPLEVADRKYKFARIMFYALPTICVLGFLAGLVPDVKKAVTDRFMSLKSELVGFVKGDWGIGVSPWYANLAGIFFALVGSAVFGFILSQITATLEDGRFRRWIRGGLGVVTFGCLAALLWFGFALYRNIAGKGDIRLPRTASAVAVSASSSAPSPLTDAMTQAAAKSSATQSTANKEEGAKQDKSPSKPTSTTKPPEIAGRRGQGFKPRANEPPVSSATATGERDKIDADFKKLLRDLE